MITIKMFDNLHLHIDASREILCSLREYFAEYKSGFMFSPKYKSGMWDGKIYLFSMYDKILPYGLMAEFLNFKKKFFPNEELYISDDVKAFYAQDRSNDNYELKPCEPWDYRPYQDKCIRKAMSYKRCIIRAATSAGKSYIIAGIIKNLLSDKKISNAIIIVPTSSLVEQFYKDIVDYGFFKEDVGRVYSKYKDWDKKIVVSTWQSLKNNISNVERFNCIIIDECHGSKASVMKSILKESRAEYRIGCTGTMPDERLDELEIKSYLGPVVVDVSASELAELGYISNMHVVMYHVECNSKFNKEYNLAKDEIFNNPFRMNIVRNIVDKCKDTVLLLVGKVETEGDILKRYLLEMGVCDEDHIVFISGDMETSLREEWRQKIINNNGEKYIICATYGTFSTGINIPNLSNLIFVSPFKSKIRILQSIGRILRKHAAKTGAIVYDIVDHNNKWFPKYGDIRLRYYDKEKFEVIEKELKEP